MTVTPLTVHGQRSLLGNALERLFCPCPFRGYPYLVCSTGFRVQGWRSTPE